MLDVIISTWSNRTLAWFKFNPTLANISHRPKPEFLFELIGISAFYQTELPECTDFVEKLLELYIDRVI